MDTVEASVGHENSVLPEGSTRAEHHALNFFS